MNGTSESESESETGETGDAGERPVTAYRHLWSDADGVSHQTRCALDGFALASVGDAAPQWNDAQARGEASVVFTVQPAGWVGDWHENPAPQWIVPLSGRWFVESMDGTRVEMGPDELSLGEDQGCIADADGRRGHRSGTVAKDAAGTVARRWLAAGSETIELVRFAAPGHPYPGGADAADPCFQHCALVVDDIDSAYARLCRFAPRYAWAAISTDGPETLPPSTGGVSAFKFRDPEGHPLELIRFPSGSGDARWREGERAEGVRGIDHSAIVVTDAAQSLAFYTGLLGLRCVQRGINRGPAQGRLDGLDDAVVDVVALAPADAPTPHVELLAYRRPRGTPLPRRARPGDAVADALVLGVNDLRRMRRRLRGTGVDVDADGDDGGTVSVHDPDGHLLVLTDVDTAVGAVARRARPLR